MAGREKEVHYHHAIASKIKEMVRAKVKIKEILAYLVKNYENPPLNEKMLRKVYGDDILAARAEAKELIGSKVYAQAVEGDFKSQEMYLTTGDDWSKKERVEHGLDDSEDGSALAKIMAMLGKDK